MLGCQQWSLWTHMAPCTPGTPPHRRYTCMPCQSFESQGFPKIQLAQLVKNLPAIQETPVRFLGREGPLKRDRLVTPVFLGFPGVSDGKKKKNLPAMWETWVQSLSGEETLEEGMATYSSILAWRILTDRGAWRAAVHGVAKSQTRPSN